LIVVCELTAIEGKAATDDRVCSIVPTLKIAANCLKFDCQSEAQFQTQCSATSKHSIAHIIRVHQVQAQNAFNADWMSLDAGAQFGGMQFRTDNARVSRLIELWLCQTDWQTYLRCLEPTSNGRGVWLAFKAQIEGPLAIKARKPKAHVELTTAYHSEGDKQSTWDNYIRASYRTNSVAAQHQTMAAIVDSGMKSRRAAADRVVSFVGAKYEVHCDGGDRCQRKRKWIGRDGGKGKKQKGSMGGGLSGQKPTKPRDATALDAHCSMSQKQLDTALPFDKAQQKCNNGSDGRTVFVESMTVGADSRNGVAAAVKEIESPDESHVAGDPAMAADDLGAPADDEDSVIAVEETKTATILFGCAAYQTPTGRECGK
jgi:hypothetical protein